MTETGTARLREALAAAGIDWAVVTDHQALAGGTFNTVTRVTLAAGARLVVKVPPGPEISLLSYERGILGTEALFYQLTGHLSGVTVPAVLFARRLVRHPWLCAGLVLLLLVAVLRPAPLTRFTTGWPPPGWRLAVCDVGQGDALALRLGDGSAVVIDTGPEPDLVDHCLRALDVRVIPLLVLTHFHADHVAGLPGVLAGRSVGAIETTSLDAPAEEASAVRRRAAAAHIPLIRAAAGEHRRLGDVDWRVLWPPPPPDGLPDDGPNDASVTLLVRTAGLTFLLLGDLEPPAQRDLLARRPDLAPVDVLKVAHHGSSYQDPELLRRVRPRLALVSVGRDNPYGHPAARTIGALRAEGATVLRTDTDGSIAVTAGERGALGAALAGRR